MIQQLLKRKNKFTSKCMYLETINLGDVIQTQKNKSLMFPLIYGYYYWHICQHYVYVYYIETTICNSFVFT